MGLDSFKLCSVTMPNMKDVRGLLLSLILLCRQLVTALLEMPVSCVAGRFNTSDTASVTCFFPENIQEGSHHVFIIRYPFNSSESEDIFRCTWTNRTTQHCTLLKEGFSFNGSISDQLKVEIPGVTADFAGSYVCQLVTAEKRPLSMCNLTVQETLTTPEENQATGLSTSVTSVIAALSSLIPIIIIVLAAVYIRRRKRGKRLLEATNGEHFGPHVAVPLKVTNGEHAGPRVARSVKWAENATDDYNWEILSKESSDEDIEVPGIDRKRTRSVESATNSEGSSSSYHTASDTDRLSPCSRDEEDER